MSNPWMPPKANVTDADDSQLAPSAFMRITQNDWAAVSRGYKAIPYVESQLEGLDMEDAASFYTEKRYCILDSVRMATKSKLVTAGTGAISARLRTDEARGFANAVYRELKEDEEWTEKLYTNGLYPLSKNAATHTSMTVMQLGGGAQFTLGRLREYYPRSDKWEGQRVPTPSEVGGAMRRCGLVLDGTALPQTSVLEEEVGRNSVTVNPNAENGFPIMGKWKDEGAAAMALGLARAISKDLQKAYVKDKVNGVYSLVRRWEAERPWAICFKGKAKTDFYTEEKMQDSKLRFYNVVGRQIQLLIQRVSQPYERAAGTIAEGFNSFHGTALPHGGADEMVTELDRRLAKTPWVHVHCGDDSWVTVRDGDAVVCFSVDCSSFDLTQAASVTAGIHLALRHQMERVRGAEAAPSAQLWYALARERTVVVAQSVVKRFKHGGPSGLPVQPKINAVLMEIYLTRLQETIAGLSPAMRKKVFTDPEALDNWIQTTAQSLGLTVRLEDYQRQEGVTTLRSFLALQGFKFVGFVWHGMAAKDLATGEPLIDVCIDLGRALGQCRYPPYLWEKQPSLRKMREGMRLGAMCLGWGIPPPQYESAFKAGRRFAVELLDEALKLDQPRGPIEESWSTWVSVYAPIEAMSMEGLRAALIKAPAVIWRARADVAEEEAPERTSSGELGNWADEMDLADPLTPAVVATKVELPKLPVLPLAHPPTSKNAGRPPPVARWGPNKAPKPQQARDSGGGAGPSTSKKPAKRRGRGRKGAPAPNLSLDEDYESLDYDEETGERVVYQGSDRGDTDRLVAELEERMFR